MILPRDAASDQESSPSPIAGTIARLQRADGAAIVRFEQRDGRSVLADLYQRTPARILFPREAPGPDGDEPPLAVLVTTSGGLTGGDKVMIEASVGSGAAATVSTQAAEKLYRSIGPDCVVAASLSVEAGGTLEWLPQETILFDRARLRRTIEVDVAGNGRLLALESVVFGRTAHGESFESGFLHDGWRVRRDGRLVWADALRLEGDVSVRLGARFGFRHAISYATLVYVGPDAEVAAMTLRELAEGRAEHAGATLLGDVVVVRLMDVDSTRLRLGVGGLVAAARQALCGRPRRLPRVWEQ